MPNPSPENPLIVVSVSPDGIPSMKNTGQLNFKTKTFHRSKATYNFLKGFSKKVKEAMKEGHFDMLPPGTPVGLFVYLKMASQDGDNVLTTVQETMQNTIIENDKMVKMGTFVVNDISRGMTEIGVAFLWVLPEEALFDKDVALEYLMRFYTTTYKGKPISKIVSEYHIQNI